MRTKQDEVSVQTTVQVSSPGQVTDVVKGLITVEQRSIYSKASPTAREVAYCAVCPITDTVHGMITVFCHFVGQYYFVAFILKATFILF